MMLYENNQYINTSEAEECVRKENNVNSRRLCLRITVSVKYDWREGRWTGPKFE